MPCYFVILRVRSSYAHIKIDKLLLNISRQNSFKKKIADP